MGLDAPQAEGGEVNDSGSVVPKSMERYLTMTGVRPLFSGWVTTDYKVEDDPRTDEDLTLARARQLLGALALRYGDGALTVLDGELEDVGRVVVSDDEDGNATVMVLPDYIVEDEGEEIPVEEQVAKDQQLAGSLYPSTWGPTNTTKPEWTYTWDTNGTLTGTLTASSNATASGASNTGGFVTGPIEMISFDSAELPTTDFAKKAAEKVAQRALRRIQMKPTTGFNTKPKGR